MNSMIATLDASWMNHLESEFSKTYMRALNDFLKQELNSGVLVYPRSTDIFNAFNLLPFDRVRVVILGQDPYHGDGQAHGLSFSVPDGVKLPPSLRNIYKELEREYGCKMPLSGDLSAWAEQGVLLLNATLTVRQAMAGSHQKKGWEQFTDSAIQALNAQHKHLVFMLWGSYAQQKGAFIDRSKHLVLEAPHPSPLSAHRGFLGCGHFKKANQYLAQHNLPIIDWTNSA